MMTWQVLLSGMGLPWIGFSFGFALAKLLKRPTEDVIAIAIETGIQNTGMSIFILWLTLDHPLGDMAGKLNILIIQKSNFQMRAINFSGVLINKIFLSSISM